MNRSNILTKAYHKFVKLYCPQLVPKKITNSIYAVDLDDLKLVCENYNTVIQKFLMQDGVDSLFYEENKRLIEDFFFKDARSGYVVIYGIRIDEIGCLGYDTWVTNHNIAGKLWSLFPRPNPFQTLMELIPKLPRIYKHWSGRSYHFDYQDFEAFEVLFERISDKNEAEQIIKEIIKFKSFTWDHIKQPIKRSLFIMFNKFCPFSRKSSMLFINNSDAHANYIYYYTNRMKVGDIPLLGTFDFPIKNDKLTIPNIEKYMIKEVWLMINSLSRNLRLPNGYVEKRLVYDIIRMISVS